MIGSNWLPDTLRRVRWRLDEKRVPIAIGASGANVTRVLRGDGSTWIEKRGASAEIRAEAAVLKWCANRLPVARLIEHRAGVMITSELPGVTLAEVSLENAVNVLIQALDLMHALPVENCPFSASWNLRLQEAEQRIEAGLVDDADFDGENLGRSAADILAELKSFPPLPDLACFTHGDACLENFLTLGGTISGIVDMGRAGITHPAQDWALALQSVGSTFGPNGRQMLRQRLSTDCANENLLRRFLLLDECF